MIPGTSETHTEGFPYEVFSVLWDNNIFYRNSWFSPLRHKVFRYPKFSETQTVSSTKFFELWDEIFSTENCDTIMHKIFRYPNFLKFWGDVRELFRLCETIIIRRKNVIPPVMHKIFRYPKFFGTLKGCPRNILALWDQKFSTENRDTPSSLPPLLSIIFIRYQIFSDTQIRKVPLRNFSALRQKKIWHKIVR